MSVTMRAKLRVMDVTTYKHPDTNETTYEKVRFAAVGPNCSYPADGTDENNSFALWTPQADLNMFINNPVLFGRFLIGSSFYVDFTEALE